MRWDPKQPLNGTNGSPGGLDVSPPVSGTTWAGNHDSYSYAHCLDSTGHIWNTVSTDNLIRQYASNRKYLNTFCMGGSQPFGCIVSPMTDDIWIAHEWSDMIGHLKNNGTLLGTVAIGDAPMGVAVDKSGKFGFAIGIHLMSCALILP